MKNKALPSKGHSYIELSIVSTVSVLAEARYQDNTEESGLKLSGKRVMACKGIREEKPFCRTN